MHLSMQGGAQGGGGNCFAGSKRPGWAGMEHDMGVLEEEGRAMRSILCDKVIEGWSSGNG